MNIHILLATTSNPFIGVLVININNPLRSEISGISNNDKIQVLFIVYCIFKLSNKHKLHILCSWNSRKCKLYGRGTFKKVSFDTIKYHFVIKVSLEVKSIIQDVNPHNLRKSPINEWLSVEEFCVSIQDTKW